MLLVELKDKASRIAAAMGPDWEMVSQDWSRSVSIQRGDGRTIQVRSHDDRLRLVGMVPSFKSGLFASCEITVNATRHEIEIAKEINRRLLPLYDVARRTAQERVAVQEAQELEKQAWRERFSSLRGFQQVPVSNDTTLYIQPGLQVSKEGPGITSVYFTGLSDDRAEAVLLAFKNILDNDRQSVPQ